MNFDELSCLVVEKKIENKIALLKPFNASTEPSAKFYLSKRNFLERICGQYKHKYKVLEAVDTGRPVRETLKLFKSIDEAANYVWMLFVNFVEESYKKYSTRNINSNLLEEILRLKEIVEGI